MNEWLNEWKKDVQSSSYSTSNMHDCIAEEIVHAKVNFVIIYSLAGFYK